MARVLSIGRAHAKRLESQHGSILVTILTLTIFLTTTMLALAVLVTSNVTLARGRILLLQAQYSAESGADAAIANLNNVSDTYSGTGTSEVTVLTNSSRYKSTYATTVVTGSNVKERIITAVGKVYAPANAATPKYTRTIRVTAQRSTTTAAASMMSRNILAISSAVQDVRARDIFVNGFIKTAKNNTNLYAENITVAGKDTGAANCSIEGPANLYKPGSFSTAGQTKTNITVAYNNCITPPGNTSNSDFNVAANQNNITTLRSLYIPWSQYMDSTYSAGSCSDWTSGAAVVNIPFAAGSKRTHYPDSGSNVSTACGSSGDISLGSSQYNITDNVHIRANLCAATACNPTFYNPTSTMRYVFVEGDINFQSVQSASGSGPIVFVTYGTDPSSKTNVCPYGGSLYIGQQGSQTTTAPALYFLAMNGLCLDGTKFGNTPGLGGIAGKNLYIATQQGQPFYITMDPNFPVGQIPVDLAWRETGYERL